MAERIIPETTVYDAEITIESYTTTRREEGKAKGPRCKDCARFKDCEGPWKEYPELYGWDGPRQVPDDCRFLRRREPTR